MSESRPYLLPMLDTTLVFKKRTGIEDISYRQMFQETHYEGIKETFKDVMIHKNFDKTTYLFLEELTHLDAKQARGETISFDELKALYTNYILEENTGDPSRTVLNSTKIVVNISSPDRKSLVEKIDNGTLSLEHFNPSIKTIAENLPKEMQMTSAFEEYYTKYREKLEAQLEAQFESQLKIRPRTVEEKEEPIRRHEPRNSEKRKVNKLTKKRSLSVGNSSLGDMMETKEEGEAGEPPRLEECNSNNKKSMKDKVKGLKQTLHLPKFPEIHLPKLSFLSPRNEHRMTLTVNEARTELGNESGLNDLPPLRIDSNNSEEFLSPISHASKSRKRLRSAHFSS